MDLIINILANEIRSKMGVASSLIGWDLAQSRVHVIPELDTSCLSQLDTSPDEPSAALLVKWEIAA